MSDFVKIFVGLVVLVIAFSAGKKFGSDSVLNSNEYRASTQALEKLKETEAQLSRIKGQFQKLLDSTDLKQAHEVLGKMMTILLADLALRISADQENQFSEGKNKCLVGGTLTMPKTEKIQIQPQPLNNQVKNQDRKQNQKNWTKLRLSTFKQHEWVVQTGGGDHQTIRNLEKAQISDINSFKTDSRFATAEDYQPLFGEYKGTILDRNNEVYSTLTVNIKINRKGSENRISIENTLIRAGKESRRSADGVELGWLNEDSKAIVVELEPGRYLQMYKLNRAQKLAGNYYEVMPNGTTKIIGNFLLSRVDRF